MADKTARYTSPRGTARYPSLIRPDTAFNKNVYKTELVVPSDAEFTDKNGKSLGPIRQFLDELAQTHAKEAKAEAAAKMKAANTAKKKEAAKTLGELASAGYDVEVDEDGNETGNIVLKFSTNATFQDRKTGEVIEKKLSLFDCKGKRTYPKSLYGGSVLKVNFTPSPYMASVGYGCKLYLNAVQIIELVEAGGDGGGFGFGDEGDGYTADEEESEGFATAEADDDDDEDDDSDF